MQIDFESVNECSVCGGSQFELYTQIKWKNNIMQFVLCQQCGLEFMNPRPTQKWYDEYYNKSFWEEKVNRSGWRDGDGAVNSEKKLKQKVKKIEHRAKRIITICKECHVPLEGQSVIEVGPGFGQISNEFKKEGAYIQIVEPSDMAAKYCWQHYGINRITKTLEDLRGLKFAKSADLIISSHVLENTCDPLFSLRCIRNVLRDEGVLIRRVFFIPQPKILFIHLCLAKNH